MELKKYLILALTLVIHHANASYQWLPKPSLPVIGLERSSGFTIGNDLYVGTGYKDFSNVNSITAEFWKYNTISGSWTQVASMTNARHGASGFAHNGKGYIANGHEHVFGNLFNDVQEYDPASNTWIVKSIIPGSARYGSACFTINGKTYLVTGNLGTSFGPFTDQNLEYDIANNSWSAKQPYPGGPLYYATAFSIGDYGYVGSGVMRSLNGSYTYYDTFYRYDPSNDTWTQIATYPGGTSSGMSSLVLQQKAIVGAGRNNVTEKGDFYIYDPVTAGWTSGPTLPPGYERDHGVALSTDSQAYISTGLRQGIALNDLWQLEGPCTPMLTYYLDADSDGFGTALVDSFSCLPPVGYVLNALDCNDADSTIYPGAIEICCNGIDEDCSGFPDDGVCATGDQISSSFLTIPVKACENTSVTISAGSNPGYNLYNWSITPAATINGNPSPVTLPDASVNMALGTLPQGQTKWQVCVSVSNGCITSNTICKYIRGKLSTPRPIVGNLVACENTNGTYTVPPVNLADLYVWSATGGIILTGTGTSVQAQFPPGFVGGDICVQAGYNCGYLSNPRCIAVGIAPPVPKAMTGTFPVCPGSTGITYSIPPVPEAVSYNWTPPPGVTITSGQGTNSVTVDIAPVYSNAKMCVTALSACGGESPPRCKTINTDKPRRPAAIQGTKTGVCGQTLNYTVPALNNVLGYTWTAPPGATLASPNGTNSISITYSNSFTDGDLCVVAFNSCSTSDIRCKNMKGAPDRPDAISGPSVNCPFETNVVYSINAVPGATGYVWSVPLNSGASIVSGQGSTAIVVDWGSAAGIIRVQATNSCGISYTSSLNVSINCKVSGGLLPGVGISVYPNPVRNILNIDLESEYESNYLIELMDLSGRIVYSNRFDALAGGNSYMINVSEFASGMYIMRVADSNRFRKEIRIAIE